MQTIIRRRSVQVGAALLAIAIVVIVFLDTHQVHSDSHQSSCTPETNCTSTSTPTPNTPTSKSACPTGMTCGSYTIAGLGARKQEILQAGGSTLDLAVAMLETNTLQATYTYGDGKAGDAANFGIFKQNWYMLRSACPEFHDQSSAQYHDGAVLNSNLSQDIACIQQSQSHYGIDTWFAGQRNGQSGLNKPDTADIHSYQAAVYWIQNQLTANTANLSNDTRFWVEVPAI